MAFRLFEGEEHAKTYHKYRFSPPEEVQNIILSYLKKRKNPFLLAVDVGCGTGLSTRLLAPYFERVIGMDVSKAQLGEAQKVPGFNNISYCISPAEALPLEDGSVDLVAAASAAHWFNTGAFMKELARVLKPKGCLALQDYFLYKEVHYGNCSEALTQIFREVITILLSCGSDKLNVTQGGYKEIFEAIPFPEKERVDAIVSRYTMPISRIIGYLESLSVYQTYLEKDPEAARAFLQSAQQRFLDTMGVSSSETEVELWVTSYCLLACKPE
ncbi:putative methyltransferase DDB_G0268948 [Latimeria chalumnae]|uniref:Methyltransferase type 11 domain-containing protein n=1 Tax=Latimeria chalumnae TaxID=7897 RepID=H3ALJ0_LATCH|nr:PREDICTED: putative methyltransferase DDB_G0268948 [Latimeria chalumnae]|eukprot:XP_006009037.1 PREDICTED: putative methyltransferase DDB_G0268948 [Latimeria chalumnae]